ncbi:MAG TPA: alpha/beta hydrolase [Euzebyales bacterium]
MTDYDRAVAVPTLTWGARGRQRALLLHGLSSSAGTWWRIADGLAGAGYNVTAPDLRGHGNAPHTVSYRLSGYAADLWELGGGWDLVVGHSLGGTLATLMAADPGFTRRLVLLDPIFMVPEDRFDGLLADQLSELDDADDPAALAAANPAWHPEDAALKARAAAQTSRYVVERTLEDNRPWWYLDLLGDVRVATDILVADPAIGTRFDPAVGDELTRHNVRITTRIVRGAGHSIHREAPGAVLSLLLTDHATYRR